MPSRATVALVAALAAGAAAGQMHGAEIRGRVVDQLGNPVGDAVVFVDELPPGTPPPAVAPKAAVMDQINKEFVPHILVIAVGTEVSFPNHDQIHHHVYSLSRTKTFEIPLYKGDPAAPVLFDQPGAVKLGCNIHDWMSSVILVVPTPYFGMTASDGAFALHDLPPGTYGVVAWHEGSTAKVEDTRQMVTAAADTAPITFTLEVVERRRRQPARRGFE
jgi:plastocyanin